jgi:aminoglycoside phosphotransferase (APT) family kinase protein
LEALVGAVSEATTAPVRWAIPLPPPDPALGGLRIALDGDAMAELLARRLPDCASGKLEVESCRPRYIRYKPGTNCLVQYELALRGEHAHRIRVLAHAWLYSDRHVGGIWAGRPLQHLIERAHRLPGLPSARAALLPEIKGLLEIYPVDRKMPGLLGAASAATVRQPLLAALSEDGDRYGLEGIELVRYKPGRKAVLRYGLRGGRREAIYGRVHADGRGAALLDAGRAFVAAGVPTPSPLRFVSDLGLLFIEEAHGRRLAELPEDEYERWLPAVAEALALFHAARVENLPPLARRNRESAVLAAARTIATVCPAAGRLALRVGATLAARLAESLSARAPVHGDFYDDQVLVSDAGIALLDFDAAGLGTPLLDVGNFLANVTADRGERPHEPFLDAYAAVRPEALQDLPLFEAAALLRIGIKPFRWLWSDWPQEVERRVALAAELLQDDPRSRGVSFSPTDARLPQLEILQDPAHIGRELERLLTDGPVEVVRAKVIRYKPGRRCLLRYDVQVGPHGDARSETLYAKLFASGRGKEVYERLRAVASAAACGPRVSIPEAIGYVAPLKLLVQRAVPGQPAHPLLLAGDEALAVRVADAIHALHRSSVPLQRRHELVDELAPLARRVDRLAAANSVLGMHGRRCLELADLRARGPWSWRWRPVHRDFYHDQVLVHERGLSILDWDDTAMSEPAIDVANFLAHLRLLGLQRAGRPDALDDVSAAFVERCHQLDGGLDPVLLRFLQGTTLLRLAEIHLPRERGEWLAERLLQQSELLLEP